MGEEGVSRPSSFGSQLLPEIHWCRIMIKTLCRLCLSGFKTWECLMSKAWDQRDITRGLEVTNNFLLCLLLQMGITSKLMLPWKPQMWLDFCPTSLVSYSLSWMCVYPRFCTWTSDDNCDFFHIKRITAFIFGVAFTLFSAPGCTVVAWIG